MLSCNLSILIIWASVHVTTAIQNSEFGNVICRGCYHLLEQKDMSHENGVGRSTCLLEGTVFSPWHLR
jgi:hypothetical protein